MLKPHLAAIVRVHFMKDIKTIQNFLSDIPGPSPWYLVSKGPKFDNFETEWMDGEKFTKSKWTGRQNKNYTGKTVFLLDNSVKMIFDFQYYVQKIDKTKFLVWYEQTDKKIATADLSIHLLIVDILKLQTINQPDEIVTMLNQNNKVGFIGEVVSKLTVKTTLDFGAHKLLAPVEFKNLGEILILAKTNAVGQESNYWDKMSLSLFILNFKSESLEIIPQDWFNKGSFDFGYQWPTRIKKEESTGDIYGDGIRIGAFRLSKNKKDIEHWYN